MLRGFFNLSGRILDGVSESFAPASNATSKEVRINGAIAIAVGFFCLALAGALMLMLDPKIGLRAGFVPVMAAYALWIVGGYRLVFGATPKADPYEVASFKRILFGVGWIVLMFGGLILAAVLLLGP